MNPSEQLLIELQSLLAKLIQPQALPNAKAVNINDLPIRDDDINPLLMQLLAEANVHLSDTWAAHMTPSISAVSLLGHVVAALHSGNLLSSQLYPVLSQIEQQTIDWFCRIFKQSHGHFVPSGSYANLDALWQAKQLKTNQSNLVYASTACHYSIAKACQILDLELVPIPCNEQGQVLTNALLEACKDRTPLAIVATLGTTALGAIDPLRECIEIAHQFDCWCHVDASWGGGVCLLPEFQSITTALANADSICIDPHKALSQPRPSSVLLYQHPLKKMDVDANYLEEAPLASLPGSYGGEYFLPLWLILASDGTSVLKKQLRNSLIQAELFADELRKITGCRVYQSPTGIIGFELEVPINLDTLLSRGVFSRIKVSGKTIYRAVFANNHVNAKTLIAELQACL